jgi:hypothetical protein
MASYFAGWPKRRPTYCQALGSSPLMFVVELTGETGARLVEALHTHIPGTGSARQVRPATVAATISQAMSTGWQPCRPGPAFTLTLDEAYRRPLLIEHYRRQIRMLLRCFEKSLRATIAVMTTISKGRGA